MLLHPEVNENVGHQITCRGQEGINEDFERYLTKNHIAIDAQTATIFVDNLDIEKTLAEKHAKEEKEALNQLYAEIAQAREILIVEKEEIIKEKAILSGKVDIAEAIKINYMEVQGYQVKNDGKTKKKNKAKNINMLRTCFLTETNVVAKGGEQEFYIRIIDPVGETIADSNDGGAGVLTNKLDNTQVMYTTSGSIDYQNEDTRGCISLSLSEKLTKGIYDVEIYNNGFMVGKGDFKLK